MGDRGEEKSSLDDFVENPQEFAESELAERVGFVPSRGEPASGAMPEDHWKRH
jgi:hypothetical protein